MLARRAVCVDEPQELIERIKGYLGTEIYPADVNDNAFLKAYGNYLDDGRSAERVTEEVIKAIEVE